MDRPKFVVGPIVLIMLCSVGLVACDGPNEKAGRKADRAAAVAIGDNSLAEGPNERLGEAKDRVERADLKANDAAADALERRGEQLRSEAGVAADQLDKRARKLRDTVK